MLFFASALAVVALIARRGRQTSWPTLAWLAVFFVIGVYALRGVAWWPLGAVAAIAGVLITGPVVDPAQPERLGSPLMRRLNAVIAIAIVVVGVVLLPVWRPIEPGLDAPQGVVGNAPPGITAELQDRARPGDRLFNPQAWGSWFEFALPDLPVGIDSRIELFPPVGLGHLREHRRRWRGLGGPAPRLGRDDRRRRPARCRDGRPPARRRLAAGLRRRGRVHLGPGDGGRSRTRPLIDGEHAGRGQPDLRRREAPAQREIRRQARDRDAA